MLSQLALSREREWGRKRSERQGKKWSERKKEKIRIYI